VVLRARARTTVIITTTTMELYESMMAAHEMER
jgi:hypothetical protein